MTPTERILSIRLLELKHRLRLLIMRWREDARTRPRRGLYYKGLATELESLLNSYEREEQKIIYEEVKE